MKRGKLERLRRAGGFRVVAAPQIIQETLLVHAGGQYEWDSYAPACVAQAHGLHASRLDGPLSGTTRPTPTCSME